MNLLDKFENVLIKNNTRLEEQDREYCEGQQRLYINVLFHYRTMFRRLLALKEYDNEFRISTSENEYESAGGYKYTIYEHDFVKIEKNDVAKEIKNVHNTFIKQINSYFTEKYDVTIERKKFKHYVQLNEPMEPKTGFYDYYRGMSDSEIDEFNNSIEKYKEEYSSYLDSIINAELHYNEIVDDVFLSLGGFDFAEKAEHEIKVATRDAVKADNKHPRYTIKNGKISFEILISRKNDNNYEIILNDDGYLSILNALTYFDSDRKQTSTYNGWMYKFTGYRKREEDGIYDTHEIYGNKVKQFKFYKNGRWDVVFDSHISTLNFAREYLGYSN